ncbi:MAG: hypothetical protein Q9181_007361 [Wetmoreana brouardii]
MGRKKVGLPPSQWAVMLTVHFNQCEDPPGVVDDGRCSQCVDNNDPCGPRETMQDSIEYLRNQPPRAPSSPAFRRQRNRAVSANNPGGQNSNDTMRMSSGARHRATITTLSPETLPTESNAFQYQSDHTFATDHDQGGPISDQEIFGAFTMSNTGLSAEDSLGNPLPLEMFLQPGSVSSPAYIKKQSSMVKQPVSGLEKHLKDAQRQIFTQMLEEADKACNDDQTRWVCDHLMSALENVDDLEPLQIESALDKIIRAHEVVGDSEVNPRLRKLICTRYPNQRTEEQNLAILIPRHPENSAIPSSSDLKRFGEYFPILHQIIEFGTPAVWKIFRQNSQLPAKLKDDHLGQNLLHPAAAKGDVGLLEVLSDLPLEIDARDRFGRTPAFIAASLGQDKAFEFLCKKGADLGTRTYESTTLLEAAAMGNHVGIIWMLNSFSYDFAEKAVTGDSPLTIAAQNGCHEATYALLKCGVDPGFRRHSDWKTAQEVALNNHFPALAEILSPWS